MTLGNWWRHQSSVLEMPGELRLRSSSDGAKSTCAPLALLGKRPQQSVPTAHACVARPTRDVNIVDSNSGGSSRDGSSMGGNSIDGSSDDSNSGDSSDDNKGGNNNDDNNNSGGDNKDGNSDDNMAGSNGGGN